MSWRPHWENVFSCIASQWSSSWVFWVSQFAPETHHTSTGGDFSPWYCLKRGDRLTVGCPCSSSPCWETLPPNFPDATVAIKPECVWMRPRRQLHLYLKSFTFILRVSLSIAHFLERSEFVTVDLNEKWEVLEIIWVQSGLNIWFSAFFLKVLIVEPSSREKF